MSKINLFSFEEMFFVSNFHERYLLSPLGMNEILHLGKQMPGWLGGNT